MNNNKSIEPHPGSSTEPGRWSGREGCRGVVAHTGVRERPARRRHMTSLSAPHMGVTLCLAGLDIRSIEPHPETSTELKKAS